MRGRVLKGRKINGSKGPVVAGPGEGRRIICAVNGCLYLSASAIKKENEIEYALHKANWRVGLHIHYS